MVVKCPNCGQQVRGEPGMSGPCPKCGTRFTFPAGDSQSGEPVKCPHCGQMQRYKDGFCINCGKALEFSKDNVSFQNDTNKNQSSKSSFGAIVAILVVVLIVFVLVQIGSGPGDSSKCYICGKESVYTTSSGYGLCAKHLIEGLDYDKRQ